MKKFLILFVLVCSTQLIFSQKKNALVWLSGSLNMNNGAAYNLDLDTNILSSGFKNLNVAVKTNNTSEFKFDRDKFEITAMNDFRLQYFVKRGFIGRTADFTLYIYSDRLMIYKRDYSIMFDGSNNPKLILQDR